MVNIFTIILYLLLNRNNSLKADGQKDVVLATAPHKILVEPEVVMLMYAPYQHAFSIYVPIFCGLCCSQNRLH